MCEWAHMLNTDKLGVGEIVVMEENGLVEGVGGGTKVRNALFVYGGKFL